MCVQNGNFMKGNKMYEINPPPGRAMGWSEDLQDGDMETEMGGMPHRIHPMDMSEKLTFGDGEQLAEKFGNVTEMLKWCVGCKYEIEYKVQLWNW